MSIQYEYKDIAISQTLKPEYHLLLPYWYLISQALNFVNYFGETTFPSFFYFHDTKKAIKFAIQAFSTSNYFSKSLNFLNFLDKLEQAKRITSFENQLLL